MKPPQHLISPGEWEEVEQSLAISEQKYRSLFDYNPNIIYALDRKGKIIRINKAAEEVLGYTPQEFHHMEAEAVVDDKDIAEARRCFAEALNGYTNSHHMHIKGADGSLRFICVNNIPTIVEGEVVGVFGVCEDKTAQKEAEDKLNHLEYHDALTGLPNRILYEKIIADFLRDSEQHQEQLAVIFLDLDRFGVINDTRGHLVGDQILKECTGRIQSVLQPQQILSRVEGDKFSLIVPHNKNRQSINRLIKKIQSVFIQPFVYDGTEYFLSAKLGVSLAPKDGMTGEVLMKNADIALYKAKADPKSAVFYKETMSAPLDYRVELESDLRRALGQQEFSLYFQPQMCLETENIYGCEALIRWHHPTWGTISPGEFIPLAEEIGLIDDIGDWVLKTACRQIKEWDEHGFSPLQISVNVSVKQFLKQNFVEHVRSIIEEEKTPPERLHIEITESATLHDIEYSIKLVKQLKAIGLNVSIDDFGTGYSALSYLKDFAPDALKIDRSFICQLSESGPDSAIVKAIIMMSHGLSLNTVAEGVETEAQLHLLRTFGCHHVQGYYISKPLPPDGFKGFIEQRYISS